MEVYPSEKIRNVALVAHGGAGKTSLSEALLFNTGATKRLGKVDEGNTTSDYQPEEIKRKISISTSLIPCLWQGYKINFLDTPGYSDFIGEVKGALRVVEGAVVLFCGVAGVEVQSEAVWELADLYELPRLAFINRMDRENANFYRALESMQQAFPQVDFVPLQLPLGAAEDFTGVIDLLARKAYRYEPVTGKVQAEEIPATYSEEVAKYRETLLEAAAEADDELLNKYLEGEELSPAEIKQGLQAGVKARKTVPVLCGSALKNIAISPLLEAVTTYFPPPVPAAEAEEAVSKPLAALIFKTLADPYVGKLSFLRVYQGVLKSDSVVFNSTQGLEEKIGTLLFLRGKNQEPLPELPSGDLGTVAKLQASVTGDTLTGKGNSIVLPGIDFPAPMFSVAIYPKSKADEDKLSSALARLLDEDTSLRLEKNTETKETILRTMGEMHLDLTLERMQRRYGVEVEARLPKIPYRETIRVAATRVEGKYKRQTGGHGQYGHVFLDLEPSPEPFEFQEKIFGGAVPKQYIPAVEKGLREAMQEGILAGYPVSNFRATLVDGSYHPVDSSELAFKIATSLAFKKAMEQAKPVLLEPVMNVEVTVPETFMGDIIGDLNSRRGRILGIEPQGKMQVIRAQVPLAEMLRYAIDLKSITQGRGGFRMEFAQYEEVPAFLAEKIIAAAREAKAES